MKEALEKVGFCKFEKIISSDWIEKITNALPEIFKKYESLRKANGNPISFKGLTMNA